MKQFKKYIFSALLLATIIFASSCELIDVTDITPVYKISDNNVITNLEQAQNVLTGTYGVLTHREEFISDLPALTAMMGISMKPGLFASKFESQFFQNDVSSDNYRLDGVYLKLYSIINNANQVISKTEKLNSDNPRKLGIIAEAKILRGMSHFYLLRLWGQFYDAGSDNGIILQLEPITNVEPKAKNIVSECYASILSDLDYGVKYGPEFNSAFYTSSLYAKALKSKVLLYKKEYSEAAALALEMLNSGKRVLEVKFSDIFKKKINNPFETLFLTPFNNLNEFNNKAFFYTYLFTVSDYYVNKVQSDPRSEAAIVTFNGMPRNNKFVNPNNLQGPDTDYLLRLAEVYLIYAEAVLRGDNDIPKAQNALNVVRERVNKPSVDIADKDALLEEIRNEKFLELGAENGEDWFDLVRYYKEGNLDIKDYKAIASDSRLILPFPYKTVVTSNNTLIQNMGY